MTPRANAQSAHPSSGPDVKRNFILQQGLCEPAAGTCSIQYSALLFQPRLVGLWVVVAAIFQAPLLFFALAAVLWWSALAPRLNPFDALYNWTLARRIDHLEFQGELDFSLRFVYISPWNSADSCDMTCQKFI